MPSTKTQTQTQKNMHASPQNLTQTPKGQSFRFGLYATLSLITAGFGVYLMFQILSANDLKPTEAVILVFFAVSFGWISMAFWSAFFGFILQLFKRDPLSLKRYYTPNSQAPLTSRVAVIMPVYNEDTTRVIAGFEATFQSVMATGQGDVFDFYILSDTTVASIAETERNAFAVLLQRLAPAARVYYRRRAKNTARKVGNIREFCESFGGHYSAMVVLDADSVMSGHCIVTLAQTLEANPHAGLIQTVPIPVRQTTFFGRFVQYAAALYSPMLATGITYWQTDTCNYWGHNAIIRLQAFIDHCGLPTLEGKAPFGGDILSHDFVEAALLRRAGWDVLLLPQLQGSYEEVPCNMIDFAKRDRRWVQGNIQHLGLLGTAQLHRVSRVHFISGALAYISSLVWLVMLALSTLDAVIRALHANVYFTTQYQLFPDWPIAKTGLITAVISLTLVLLLGPKVMGLIVALCHKRRAFG
ncbi:MAG: glucans biosynthesis glucosyltransferase MdoH, partial [Marinagarivorans sp.]|nr:glucans biosynthesis glucosyltransferase MdoH [Marinagarivorans sp.]